MSRNGRVVCLRAGGYALSVLPPLAVAAAEFPVWMRGGDGPVLSVFGLLVLLLCCIPFRRGLREALRSPSAWQMWLSLFLAVWLTAHISQGMMAVAAAGVLGSVPGAVLFKLADAQKAKDAGASRARGGAADQHPGRGGSPGEDGGETPRDGRAATVGPV